MKQEITLRKWSITDLSDLVKNANDPLIAGNMMDQFPHPYSEEDGASFIAMANSFEPQRFFTIEVEGVACGGIGIHPQTDVYRKNAELGYWLGRSFWGRGIVPEAIHRMVEYAFSTFDIDRIFARPFGSNLASQRVLEKCGFILEARIEKNLIKNGRREDELIYALRRAH